MELYITKEGSTLAGKPTYWLDCDEENEDGDKVNHYGQVIEDGDHFAGFFPSEDKAREWAREKGHTIIE